MNNMMAWLKLSLLSLPCLARAACDCGFSAVNPDNPAEIYVFTEMLETDFTLVDDISSNQDWVRQGFNVSAVDGRGKYGKAFMPSNVDTKFEDSDEDDLLENEGLGLLVGKVSAGDDAVPVAEIDSARLDLHWGSYRASLKATDVNGTCAAFFWYFNDTQEIDFEFLSREFDHDASVYPISLVIQSKESLEKGYDASRTGAYQRFNLTFDPTQDFHEYRFDFVPGRVIFYADSQVVADMKGEEVPSVGGHLILQHWSNGNKRWSGGPPETDAMLSVSYVKAYFNSSDPQKLAKKVEQCNTAGATDGTVCPIPDVTEADVDSGGHFFGGSGRKKDNETSGNGPNDGLEGGDVNDKEDEAWHMHGGLSIALWLACTTMWLQVIY